MEYLEFLDHYIDSHAAQFTALSDSIWDEPELRWTEHRSVQKQIDVIAGHGFTVTENVGGIPTAFYAEKGQGGPVIAVLGEFDALAGLSQASGCTEPTPDPASTTTSGQGCGHNLLGSASLLAAVAAAKYLEENNLPGRVRYYGCPAEEAAAGKTFMVASGAFEDVDAAVTWHPMEGTTWFQPLMLAYAQVYFHFKGVASHAGAMPHLGRSALDALELMNVGVNFLREHMPDTARIHYAITDAGGESPNVVQAQASGYYIIRAEDTRQMKELYERVVKVAEGAALMTETELSVDFEGACSEILPNEALEAKLADVLGHLGGVPFDEADQSTARDFGVTLSPRAVQSNKVKYGWSSDDERALHDDVFSPPMGLPRVQMTGSSDVGDVSWVTPTVQVYAATCAIGTPFHTWQTVAQGKLPAAHKGLIHAGKAMAAVAVSAVTDAELLEAARTEFEELITRTPYESPLLDGVVAPPLRKPVEE